MAPPQRKHPAHGVLACEGASTIVFVTVCTRGRLPWLATHEVHQILGEVWTSATAWLVGRYVIMPDHIHLFAGWRDLNIPLDNWVRYWKSLFSKRHRNAQHRWQTDHWDRRLRSGDSYEEKWIYMENNPVRHGLVTCASDWPFQGEIYRLSME